MPSQCSAKQAVTDGSLDISTSRRKFEDRFVLAQLLLNRGNLAIERGQLQAALAHAERGISIVEPMLKVEPANKPLREVGFMFHGTRAEVLMSTEFHRYLEAAAEWDRGFAFCDQPVVPIVHRIARARCLILGGEYEKGLAAALELAQRLGAGAKAGSTDLYKLATLFGLAATAAKAGHCGSMLPHREGRVRSCADSAVNWLKRHRRRLLRAGSRRRHGTR